MTFDEETPIKTPRESIVPPTYQEVDFAIKKMKNNRASGEESITGEIWKYAAKEIKEAFHKNIRRIWKEEQLPEHWTVATIHPLHKKG